MHRPTPIKFLTALTALVSMIVFGGQSIAQTMPKISDAGVTRPKTIMYVGNSFFYYNNSMHSQVSAIATAADPQNRAAYRGTSITMSGSGLNWHDIDSYFKPGGVWLPIRSSATTKSASTSLISRLNWSS